MIIEKRCSVDGSKAAFQKVFQWPNALSEAGGWLLALPQKEPLPKNLFLFLTDTAVQPDSRITRYRKMNRRPLVRTLVDCRCELVEEGLEETEVGLLFWCVTLLSEQALTVVIDHLRLDRGSYLFFAENMPSYDATLAKVLKPRAEGMRVNVDQKTVIDNLIQDDLIPVRIWGPPGDKELWVEIYV